MQDVRLLVDDRGLSLGRMVLECIGIDVETDVLCE